MKTGIRWDTEMSWEQFCLMEKSIQDLVNLLSHQNQILKGQLENNHPVFSLLINHFLVLNIAAQESLNKLLKHFNETMFELIKENAERGNA